MANIYLTDSEKAEIPLLNIDCEKSFTVYAAVFSNSFDENNNYDKKVELAVSVPEYLEDAFGNVYSSFGFLGADMGEILEDLIENTFTEIENSPEDCEKLASFLQKYADMAKQKSLLKI